MATNRRQFLPAQIRATLPWPAAWTFSARAFKSVTLLLSLVVALPVGAQTTWDYHISDAGGGNSLITWSVSGSLATPPGAIIVVPQSSLAMSVVAPGIFADTYSAGGAPLAIPAPDGSFFQYGASSVYAPVVQYLAENTTGNDTFGLIAPLLPRTGVGMQLLYVSGTESTLVPIDFSNFNPGTYKSVVNVFDSAVTVNLTVEAVPEPTSFALAIGALACVLFACKRNGSGTRLTFPADKNETQTFQRQIRLDT